MIRACQCSYFTLVVICFTVEVNHSIIVTIIIIIIIIIIIDIIIIVIIIVIIIIIIIITIIKTPNKVCILQLDNKRTLIISKNSLSSLRIIL